jgi:hypothetical protein
MTQVGTAALRATTSNRNGAARDSTWTITSDVPLSELLARPTYEIPDGTPLIRLDLTADDVYFTDFIGGPHWDAYVPAGHVRPPLGQVRPYAGETWTDMARWWVALDVYVDLAPTAGVVVERLISVPPHPSDHI